MGGADHVDALLLKRHPNKCPGDWEFTMECFEAAKTVLGICIERKMDLGNAVLAALGLLGLLSVWLAYRQLKLAQKAQLLQATATRTCFILDLNQEFLRSDAERKFFYKLDYKEFTFDPDKFAESDDERDRDRLLYKLSYVGKLLRDRLLTLEDVSNIRHIAGRTLRNDEVLKYLRYLKKEQIPDHNSFSEAVYLFERMFGKRDPCYPAIKTYLGLKEGRSRKLLAGWQ
jgi:hypothetical protein